MNTIKFAKEVHENSVNHGWWEGEMNVPEIVALIHSEWSEALEEFRAGRPMVWYSCTDNNYKDCSTVHPGNCRKDRNERCEHKKPAGIAVELIDGCIRILDYLCHIGYRSLKFDAKKDAQDISTKNPKGIEVPLLITFLHRQTAKSIESPYRLVLAIRYVFAWITANGLDPEAIMREKHAYNVTRPYKHGGKVC